MKVQRGYLGKTSVERKWWKLLPPPPLSIWSSSIHHRLPELLFQNWTYANISCQACVIMRLWLCKTNNEEGWRWLKLSKTQTSCDSVICFNFFFFSVFLWFYKQSKRKSVNGNDGTPLIISGRKKVDNPFSRCFYDLYHIILLIHMFIILPTIHDSSFSEYTGL